MQTPREISESLAMHGISVALLSEDREHLSALQTRLEATRLGRAVFTHLGYPVTPTDAILRQLQESRAEVVIVDVTTHDAQRAVRAIELEPVNTWITQRGPMRCRKLSPVLLRCERARRA
jgi:hypothetical protein